MYLISAYLHNQNGQGRTPTGCWEGTQQQKLEEGISHGQSSSPKSIDGEGCMRKPGENQGSCVRAGILTISQSNGRGPVEYASNIPLGNSQAQFP